MTERIYKLQPDRTISLRGFDTYAAAASIHSATPAGFNVSGTFRDPADFAVAVLYDADNFYEHPSIKYLPDFNFAGLTLNFNVHYTDGVQPIDSPKFDWIDWARLDCVPADGSAPPEVRLWDNAMLAGPAFPAASATFNVVTTGVVQPYDRVTLWYLNLAFDYIAPGGNPVSAEFTFYVVPGGAGTTTHSITIGGVAYSHLQAAGENSADQAAALITNINYAPDPYCIASPGSSSNAVALAVRPEAAGNLIALSASGANAPVNIYASSPAVAAAALTAQINAVDWTAANATHSLLATSSGAQITITASRYGTVNVSGTSVAWVSGAPFSGITAGSTFRIGSVFYTVDNIQSPKALTIATAAAPDAGVLYAAPRGGRDGNMILMYSLSKAPTLSIDQANIPFSGGSSDVIWNCTIDFDALHINQLRQCWLTFAPALANSAAFTATEWQATFSNWQLTGPEDVRKLQVPGPGSARIEETDVACVYTGVWNTDDSTYVKYSKYFAKATSDPHASVTIRYGCQFPHQLYVGTSLYGYLDAGGHLQSDRAVAGVQIDGDTATPLDCRLNTGSALIARRLLRPAAIPAGIHFVTITIQQAGWFYLDFLEAAVPTDVPAARAPRAKISPALDFDTDHTYKLSPARLMWSMDKLGYAGPMNEYLGVFWWNERKPVGITVSEARITFAATGVSGNSIIFTLNGTSLGKTIFPADTPATIANHFAAYINETFVGTWASATTDGVLTITGRSPASAYNVAVAIDSLHSTPGLATITQEPVSGVYGPGSWVIDETVTPPINRATRDWHADFYAQCAARGREIVTACSMELVNPPDGFVARYSDGGAVSTSTGFGALVSNHCAIGSPKMLAYQKAVYRNIAQLQSAAGLIPSVQFGEFLWWFLAGASSMAYYDSDTKAAALGSLGAELHVFKTTDDDPAVNAGRDALFLRNRLRDHVAALAADIRSAFPDARCEVLWPYDVNYPTPLPDGLYQLGGQLNRFINLPVEWQTPGTSGLDRIKIEGLAFGSRMRSIDLARQALELFAAFGWPRSSLRYLAPVFGQAVPWGREVALVWSAGFNAANLWAFDHICLFNLAVPEPVLERRSVVKAA